MEENTVLPKAQSFMSEQIGELVAALSEFQGSVKQPKLNKDVSVKTRSGSGYGFRYADLSACVEAARLPLKENGLAVAQMINDGKLVTLLAHKSGQWIRSEVPIMVGNSGDYQALGSAITYLKRYSYCALLGIVADDDDDANRACGNDATERSRPADTPTFSPEQMGEALGQIECANTYEEAKGVWDEWQRKCPALCNPTTDFYKAAMRKTKAFKK